MTFTFRVYYEENSIRRYGEIKYKLIRAKTKEQAMIRFEKKFGIKPIEAV